MDEKESSKRPLQGRMLERTGFGDKTLWDLLQLQQVPLALAGIGFWFTSQQEARQHEIEDQRAQVEREIEAERAEQGTLQAYLKQMGTLLLDRGLRAADENSDVRRLARARTLVVLDALSPPRQERALRFLNEAQLIQGSPPDEQPVIPSSTPACLTANFLTAFSCEVPTYNKLTYPAQTSPISI